MKSGHPVNVAETMAKKSLEEYKDQCRAQGIECE